MIIVAGATSRAGPAAPRGTASTTARTGGRRCWLGRAPAERPPAPELLGVAFFGAGPPRRTTRRGSPDMEWRASLGLFDLPQGG
jgi:hypothetical protein